MSALESLSHYDIQMHPFGLEILSILQFLRNKSFNIIFCWVLSHVGVSGNETADAIAKFASPFLPRALPCSDIKKSFVSHLFSVWQQTWSLQFNNKLHSVKPSIDLWPILPIREVDVKLTRLRIGHTRFTHKHLIFGERAPECPTCHQNFTVHHILIECPSFKSHRVHHFHSSSVIFQDLVSTGVPIPRYPGISTPFQFTLPFAFCFLLIPSIPRRQERELSMRSCCHSVCFLLLMDSQKPHVLAVRGDPFDGWCTVGPRCINSAGILTVWLVC
ncbi:hypothetical protein AVEN_229706-1 [Araneus ventricosus]|uniref:Uncharacterized protein n=1 Tax=Araneus ventricosus TaxID=182803 RepID=A0A4Y2R6B4_ARAVE|nr:hypothetical protein AVEN_229706-1 [Araneus ventricosus]